MPSYDLFVESVTELKNTIVAPVDILSINDPAFVYPNLYDPSLFDWFSSHEDYDFYSEDPRFTEYLDAYILRQAKLMDKIFYKYHGVHLMTAIAAIVINDGATTPVAHTFNPVASSPDALYRESIVGLALLGQGTIKVVLVSDKGNGLNKVRLTIDLPALEVVSGVNSLGYSAAPKVGYSDRVNVDFILPSRATAQQRKDLRVLLMNALANAQIVDAIENLNTPY